MNQQCLTLTMELSWIRVSLQGTRRALREEQIHRSIAAHHGIATRGKVPLQRNTNHDTWHRLWQSEKE
jgi:hypothetical protein